MYIYISLFQTFYTLLYRVVLLLVYVVTASETGSPYIKLKILIFYSTITITTYIFAKVIETNDVIDE